jgi:antitoxin MazE
MHLEILMPKAQLAKWGNSLAVRIPKDVAEQVRLREGDPIMIEALEGRIELRPAERIPTLEELVAQITPENRHEETDWGPDVGKEIVEW